MPLGAGLESRVWSATRTVLAEDRPIFLRGWRVTSAHTLYCENEKARHEDGLDLLRSNRWLRVACRDCHAG